MTNDDLKQTLLSAKFCWDKEGSFLPGEFYGDDEQNMGLLDKVQAILDEQVKKAFMAGYEICAQVVAEEDPLLCVDKIANQITAEREYLRWR
jgi:hypothetical protein